MKRKVAGIVFIVGSMYYLLAEAVSATFFKASLFNTYVFHAISDWEFQMGILRYSG